MRRSTSKTFGSDGAYASLDGYVPPGNYVKPTDLSVGSRHNAGLWYDHKCPVISIVIYLFKTHIIESPISVRSGREDILTFRFRVQVLWELDAKQYVEEHAIGMYTLLPAMKNADERVLITAIDELVEHFKGDQPGLA